MKKIVTYETAQLAKNNNYLDPVNNWYDENKNIIKAGLTSYDEPIYEDDIKRKINKFSILLSKNDISAPYQTELQDWLRDNYNIYVRVASNSLDCHFPMIELMQNDGAQGLGPRKMEIFKTYYEALESGLYEALLLLKK